MPAIDEYTDSTIMPIGMNKGKPMKDVPLGWLGWYYNQNRAWYTEFKNRRNRIDTLISIPHIKTKYLLCEYIEQRLINPEL